MISFALDQYNFQPPMTATIPFYDPLFLWDWMLSLKKNTAVLYVNLCMTSGLDLGIFKQCYFGMKS